ncbi:MAG: hypothetical protein KDD40_08030, partial [Bdellovibrionales bacterium]|nr:hypothetical protein [Bdellovibrionales bacterium]
YQYLDSFLKTKEGENTLQLIKDGKENSLVGIPSPEEFSLTALNAENTPPAEEVIDNTLTQEDEPTEVAGSATSQQEDTPPVGDITNQDEEISVKGQLDLNDDSQKITGKLAQEDDLTEVTGSIEAIEVPVKITNHEDPLTDNLNASGTLDSNEDIVEVNGADEPELGKIKIRDISGPLGEVLELIEQNVRGIEDKLNDENIHGLNKNDQQVLHNCTLKMADELIKIKGSDVDNPCDNEEIITIANNLQQHVQIIKGQNIEDPYGSLSALTEEFESQINHFRALSKDKSVPRKKVNYAIKLLNQKLENLKKFSQGNSNVLVSSVFSNLLRNIERKVGHRIQLPTDLGEYEEIPDYLKDKIKIEDVAIANNEDLNYFRHQVTSQALMIRNLNKKYSDSQSALTSLREKWYLFRLQAKRNLDGSNILAAKEIDEEFKKFEKDFSTLNNSSSNIVSMNDSITEDLGGSDIKINPDLLAKIYSELGAGGTKDSKTSESESKPESETATTESREEEATQSEEKHTTLGSMLNAQNQSPMNKEQMDQFESENQVLKVQLANSQKLLDSANIELKNINELLEKNNELTAKLEEESTENKKIIAQLEEKVEILQSAENRFNETISDAEANHKSAKVDIEGKLEEIQDLKNELNIKNMEIQSLKKNEKWETLSKVKDDKIIELTKRIDNKQDEASQAKKEFIKVNAKLENLKEQHRRVAHKLDRLKGEQEAVKKQMRSTEAKYQMNLTALKQTRKTVDKLTHTTEELRKDRQKYILKTNEALGKYKMILTESRHLNRQVDSHSEEIERLRNEIKSSQQNETTLKKQLNEAQQQLEVEQKKMEDLLQQLGLSKTG